MKFKVEKSELWELTQSSRTVLKFILTCKKKEWSFKGEEFLKVDNTGSDIYRILLTEVQDSAIRLNTERIVVQCRSFKNFVLTWKSVQSLNLKAEEKYIKRLTKQQNWWKLCVV